MWGGEGVAGESFGALSASFRSAEDLHGVAKVWGSLGLGPRVAS